MSLEADALKVSQGIHIQYDADGSDDYDDHISIQCNYCGSETTMFFKGVQEDATNASSWLADAITHLIEKHPERM